jgi:hypothetical protein
MVFRYFEEIERSNNTYFRRLREATKKNPVKIVTSVRQALNEVSTGNYIFPIQEDSFAALIAKERCDLTHVSFKKLKISRCQIAECFRSKTKIPKNHLTLCSDKTPNYLIHSTKPLQTTWTLFVAHLTNILNSGLKSPKKPSIAHPVVRQ